MTRRRTACLPTLLLAAASGACFEGSFTRANPTDSRSPYAASIAGLPDSFTVQGTRHRASVVFDPPAPAVYRVLWSSSHPRLRFSTDGEFFGTELSSEPAAARVTAAIGDRRLFRDVLLVALIDTITASCASSRCDTLRTLGRTIDVRMRAVDAGGTEVRNPGYALIHRGEYALRTPGILDAGAGPDGLYRYGATDNGSTWIVYRGDRGADSLHVVVQQFAAGWTLRCVPFVGVGFTVTHGVESVVDSSGQALRMPTPEIRWSPGEELAGPGGLIGAQAVVTPDGAITGVSPGIWRTHATVPEQGDRRVGHCDTTIH